MVNRKYDFEPGKVTQAEVRQARNELENIGNRWRDMGKELDSCQRQGLKIESKLNVFRWILKSRLSLDKLLPRLGFSVIIITVLTGLCVVFSVASSLSIGTTVLEVILVIFIGGILDFLFFYFPSDTTFRSQILEYETYLIETQDYLRPLQNQVATLQEQYNKTNSDYQHLKKLVESRLHHLLTCNWQSMKGDDFEQFVSDIFLELGYRTEIIGGSGDHGVDVLAKSDQWRLAVQAKGYPSGNAVSNDVVLKVIGGMTFYRCTHSVVVTNSRFTKPAYEAAKRTGCILIDSRQIPNLIRGQISALHPLSMPQHGHAPPHPEI